MKKYPFWQVDAFTQQPLGGNPCAVILDADDLDEATMLAIAREMNLSETAFVRRSQQADFGVRYFTPAEEIPLAGHPTIATTYALVDSGRLPLTQEHTTISLELQVGPIPVEIFSRDGQVERIVMSQVKPRFLQVHDPAEVLPIFGLEPEDALPGYPIQTVSTGTPQLMLPLQEIGSPQSEPAWTLPPTRLTAPAPISSARTCSVCKVSHQPGRPSLATLAHRPT